MKKLVLALMVTCSMNVIANEQEKMDLLIQQVNLEMEKQVELMQTNLEKEISKKIEIEIKETIKIKVIETEKI